MIVSLMRVVFNFGSCFFDQLSSGVVIPALQGCHSAGFSALPSFYKKKKKRVTIGKKPLKDPCFSLL